MFYGERFLSKEAHMSDQNLPAQLASGADGQSTPFTTPNCPKKRRGADNTIKDQDAVRAYLSFKQTKGLMSDSEKRLLDKIAAVCGMSIGAVEQNITASKNFSSNS
jgi:hypothetical protein